MTTDEMLSAPQYSIPQAVKERGLAENLSDLTDHHRKNCPGYARILDIMYPGFERAHNLGELPFIPVGLFKSHALQSVPDSEVFRTLYSSGTTGQRPSSIVLDRDTAQRQTVALSKIMTHILGPHRIPMILVETASVVQDRRNFNARVAGLFGMMRFGRDHFYLLDENHEPDLDGLRNFLSRFGGRPFLIFGFTFLVWTNLLLRVADLGLDLSNGIVVHSGGWKKLQDQAVGPEELRRRFKVETGLTRIHNFYGMVEQVGSVFLEGEDGFLYPPNFADVLVRDPVTFEELPSGQAGLLQVVSALPTSYPGHSLLTEDLGVVHSIDSLSCGRMGKAFSVIGRIPRAELRGCSDVIATKAE